jgi:hypothetical protein
VKIECLTIALCSIGTSEVQYSVDRGNYHRCFRTFQCYRHISVVLAVIRIAAVIKSGLVWYPSNELCCRTTVHKRVVRQIRILCPKPYTTIVGKPSLLHWMDSLFFRISHDPFQEMSSFLDAIYFAVLSIGLLQIDQGAPNFLNPLFRDVLCNVALCAPSSDRSWTIFDIMMSIRNR